MWDRSQLEDWTGKLYLKHRKEKWVSELKLHLTH